jgi:ADP-heptose:LPS heptosyltransferase
MKILIFHIGSLGDTLVSVPALHEIRKHFSEAKLTLLSDNQTGKNYVKPQDILEGSGLVDEYLSYSVDKSQIGKLLRLFRMIQLLVTLRIRRFDKLVYLIRTKGKEPRVSRDIRFFRLAGIKKFIGAEGFVTFPKKIPGHPLQPVPQVGDQYLTRLAASGMAVPPTGKGSTDLNVGESEEAAVKEWLAKLPYDGGRRWIGIGPGSKMTAKLWPIERYEDIGYQLISKFDLWPIIFGGQEDRQAGMELVARWGRGYVAAGSLNVRQSIATLEKCVLFVGNDTGTMHMAVAANVRCVGVFTSRDYPGHWYPYGDGHVVLRTPIECEGCMLETCVEKRMKCIMSISVDQVYISCEKILREIDS